MRGIHTGGHVPAVMSSSGLGEGGSNVGLSPAVAPTREGEGMKGVTEQRSHPKRFYEYKEHGLLPGGTQQVSSAGSTDTRSS